MTQIQRGHIYIGTSGCAYKDWYGEVLSDFWAEYPGTARDLHDMPQSACSDPLEGDDFIYLRFHGPKGDYGGSCEDDYLQS